MPALHERSKAGTVFDRESPDRAHHGRPWTQTGAPGTDFTASARAPKRTGNTEPVVVVAVSGVVPVAVGRADVPRVVVPGTAAQHVETGAGQAPKSG